MLFFIRVLFEFEVEAVHVPGTANGWADAILVTMYNFSYPRFLEPLVTRGRFHSNL